MSNPYTPSTQPGYQQPAKEENTIAVIGFIFAIISFTGICIAAPIGLILSIIGLRKEPRGLAIAGFIISGITTLFYGFIAALYGTVILACIGLGAAVTPSIQTISALTDAAHQIEDAKNAEGSYPGAEKGNALIADKTDYWKQPLRYEPTADGFVVRSAGADKKFDTSDDMTMDDHRLAPRIEIPPESEMPELGHPEGEMPEDKATELPPAEAPPAELPPAEAPPAETEPPL